MSGKNFEAIASALEWQSIFMGLLVRQMRRQGWAAKDICSFVYESKPEDQPMERLVAGLKRFPSEIYAADWIPSGCKVMDDVTCPEFEMKDLEWLPVLDTEKLETFVWGETMRDQALANNAAFGLTEGKKYFWENQDKIPVDIAVVLAGTLLFDTADKRLKVCQLYREKKDGPLCRNYPVLHFGWYKHHRLPRIKSV